MRRFSGSVSVISYGKRNPLIGKEQGNLPEVLIFDTRGQAIILCGRGHRVGYVCQKFLNLSELWLESSQTAHDREPFPNKRSVVSEGLSMTRGRCLVECPHHLKPPLNRPLPLAVGASHLFGDRPQWHDLDPCRLDNATRPS